MLPVGTVCSFEEGSSDMDPDSALEELSSSLQSCIPFSVSNTDPSIYSIAQGISSCEVLANALNSTSIDDNSGPRDDEVFNEFRFDDSIEMKIHNNMCLAPPRRSARVTKLNQKNQTSKSGKKSGKKAETDAMLDSILLRVARKARSYDGRPARSSAWGSVGISQFYENTASVVPKKGSKKTKKCASTRGSLKEKNDHTVSGSIMSNGKTRTPLGHLCFKIKLGKDMGQTCPYMGSVTENGLQNFVSVGAEIHKVTDFSGSTSNEKVLEVRDTQYWSRDLEKVAMSSESLDKCSADRNLPIAVTCEGSDEFAVDNHGIPSLADIEGSGVAINSKYVDLGTSPDSEVIDLIPEARVEGKEEEYFQDVNISSQTLAAPGGIPCPNLPHRSSRKEKNINNMPHISDSNMQDGLDSLETLNSTIVVQKTGHRERVEDGFDVNESSILTATADLSSNTSSSEEFSGELLPSSRAADVGGMVSCAKKKGQKQLKNSRSKRVSKIGSKSSPPRSQKENPCRHKGNTAKSVSRKKVKDKAACKELVQKDENFQETGCKSSDCYGKADNGDGNTLQEVSSLGMSHDDGNHCVPPRNAWVRCDECLKWRRIPAILADSIEETNRRWTCKDNVDRDFADCSIPQEKSNSDINAELEISDASCEEDACNGHFSSKRSQASPAADCEHSSWRLIKSNMFMHRSRKSQSIDEIMVCHCKPPTNGKLGCGDGCLNRMLNIECVQGTCPCGERCSNQQFQKRKYAKLSWFRCGKKGYGLQLQEDIFEGQFLIEYIGEVLDMQAYEARQRDYASKGHKHFYFMTLNGSEVIDACAKGNLGRFINHSCEPNCRTEKWMVNGEVCIGLFALKDLKKGVEVTFDYNYVRVFGAAAKKCVCGSSQCRGYIGGDPRNSEVIVQGDSDDEFPEPVMVYDDAEIDDSLKKLISGTSPLDDTKASITKADPIMTDKDALGVTESLEGREEQQVAESDVNHLEFNPANLCRNSAVSEKQQTSFEKVEKSVDTLQPFVQTAKTSSQQDSASCDTITDPQEAILSSPEASALYFSEKNSVLDSSGTKKKVKSDKVENRRALKSSTLMKASCLSSMVKKGKPSSSSRISNPGNVKKSETMVKRSHGFPFKPKKIIEGSPNGRFEAVEGKLNELLDTDGGISKRKDASKGYLKLLLLTVASGDNSSGEAIQSNRDLSMILDAILKTKSRSVLVDIISKNGLQMLHNMLKRYRTDFSKIPILRKLLKVIEFLAATEILTLELINRDPSCPGVESFRGSILSFTEHEDKQVHQIARNFRDRWIPRHLRKSTGGLNCSRYSAPHNHWRENSRTRDAVNFNKHSVSAGETVSVDTVINEGGSSSCTSVCPTNGTPTRKRKSRWDQPAHPNKDPKLQHSLLQSSCFTSQSESGKLVRDHAYKTDKERQLVSRADDGGEAMDEDVPPGFAPCDMPRIDRGYDFPCKLEIGHPQGKFLNRMAVSYGIPMPVVQQLGFSETGDLRSWVIAPGVPFQPFPPLPPYSRNRSDNSRDHHLTQCRSGQNPPSTSGSDPSDMEMQGTNLRHNFREARDLHSLGRRYFRQQKWNKSRGLPHPGVRKRDGWGFRENDDSRSGICSVGGPNGSERACDNENASSSFARIHI